MKTLTLKTKTSFGKKIACIFLCFVMVVTFTPFSTQAVFADTKDGKITQRLSAAEYGTEAWWKAAYNVNSITYYTLGTGSNTLSSTYTSGCGVAGVYFVKSNVTSSVGVGTSPIVVSGNVTLVLVKSGTSGPTLNLTGGNASGTTGAGAGIEIPSTASLMVKGVGTINATGGAAAKGNNGTSGTNPSGDGDEYDTGRGGDSGAGGGGAGAAIGTKGGSGGGYKTGASSKHVDTGFWGQSGNTNGGDGTAGSSGSASSAAGTFKSAGKITLTLNGGSAAINSSEAAGYGTGKDMGGTYYHYGGGGGGGGGGGYGAPGATIGSGGSGGGSGGSGGSGGGEWSSSNNSWFDNGGGGGGGAGYYGGKGGLAHEAGKAVPASRGKDAGNNSTLGGEKGGGGGKGSHLAAQANGQEQYGGNGGAGGGTSYAGSASYTSYVTTLSSGSSTSGSLQGSEATRIQVYPIDECEITLTEYDSWDHTSYELNTSGAITPTVSIKHIPTNRVLTQGSSGDYTVSYSDNTAPGVGHVMIAGTTPGSGHTSLVTATMDSNGLPQSTSMAQPAGTSFNISIKYGVNITTTSSFNNKVEYSGSSFEAPTIANGQLSVKMKKDSTSVSPTSMQYKWYDYTNPSQPIELSSVPKNAGKYAVQISTSSGNYTGQSQMIPFEITPKTVTASAGTLKVSKTFDGSTNVTGHTGTPEITGGVYDVDKSKVSVNVVSYPSYSVSNVHTDNSKQVQLQLVDSTGANNYVLDNSTSFVNVPYEITPALVTVQAQGMDRVYNPTDYSAQLDPDTIQFSGVPAGQQITSYDYTLSVEDLDTNTVGSHSFDYTFDLNSNGNYKFTNNSYSYTGSATMNIGPLTIDKPVESTDTYIYSGTQQTYGTPGTEQYSVTGNTGTDAGAYTAVYSLNDQQNTAWKDGTKTNVQIPWTILQHEPVQVDGGGKVVAYDINKLPTEPQTRQINLSGIPEGMKKDLSLQISGIEDEGGILQSCTVDQNGLITYTFSGVKPTETTSAFVTIAISSKNYQTSIYTFQVSETLKNIATIDASGIQATKDYDGQPASSSGNLVITYDGVDITDQIPPNHITYEWYDIDSELLEEAPKDAGRYWLTIYLNDDEQTYTGQTSVLVTINPAQLTVSDNTLNVTKEYDGTRNVGTVTGGVTLAGVVQGETVTVTPQMIPYYTSHIQNTSMSIKLQVSGDTISNYVLEDKTVDVPYSITPKVITMDGAAAISRAYEKGNRTVEMGNPIFSGLVQGDSLVRGKDYTISKGNMGTDRVGTHTARYTVSLGSTDYIFANGKRTVRGKATVTINPATDGTLLVMPNLLEGKYDSLGGLSFQEAAENALAAQISSQNE